jgi:hypothetical protein
MSSSYNPYAAGNKVYRGTSSAPNYGPVTGKEGYADRDRKYKTQQKNNALLRRIKARQKGRYMSSENLSAPVGRTI